MWYYTFAHSWGITRSGISKLPVILSSVKLVHYREPFNSRLDGVVVEAERLVPLPGGVAGGHGVRDCPPIGLQVKQRQQQTNTSK